MVTTRVEPLSSHWTAWGDWIERMSGVRVPAHPGARAAVALANFAAKRGVSDMAGYLRTMVAGDPHEVDRILEAVLNGETRFFRHPVWFDRFREVLEKCRKPCTVWSAGCSSGQEAYSLAMTALRTGDRTIRVIGTDLNRRHLSRAKAGVYSLGDMGDCSERERQRFFAPLSGGREMAVLPELKKLVRFAHSNLLEPTTYPSPGFDVIFCRNVLLYFRPELRQRCLENFREWLRPGGYLFLGPADALGADRCPGLTPVLDADCVWYCRTE